MTLFRPHRGSLEEAMAEVVDLPDHAALVAHLNKLYESSYKPEDVRVEPYNWGGQPGPGYDSRIGWHTYIVTTDGSPAGFTNGPLPTSKRHAIGPYGYWCDCERSDGGLCIRPSGGGICRATKRVADRRKS